MKLWKKISVAVLAGVLAVGPVAAVAPKDQVVAHAAEAYTYKTAKNNQTFEGESCTITLKKYYKRVVLSGSSSTVKSINKQLKKYSDEFMAEPSGAVEYAKEKRSPNSLLSPRPLLSPRSRARLQKRLRHSSMMPVI